MASDREKKDSAALVIIEDLLDRDETSATILTLHGRLPIRSGDLPTAAQQFSKAISQDPSLPDSALLAEWVIMLSAPIVQISWRSN